MPRNVLNITLQKQRSGNWCYAAIIEAVNFFKLAPLSQENIAASFGKNSEGMQDPYDKLVERNLIDTTIGNGGTKRPGPPSWTDLTESIDNGRPLISKVGKHYILLIGYEGTSARDPARKYIFLDPLVGSAGGQKEITYEELTRNGFLTDYLHTGKPAYEPYAGTLFTKPPGPAGGKRKTLKRKMHKRKTLKRKAMKK